MQKKVIYAKAQIMADQTVNTATSVSRSFPNGWLQIHTTQMSE